MREIISYGARRTGRYRARNQKELEQTTVVYGNVNGNRRCRDEDKRVAGSAGAGGTNQTAVLTNRHRRRRRRRDATAQPRREPPGLE